MWKDGVCDFCLFACIFLTKVSYTSFIVCSSTGCPQEQSQAWLFAIRTQKNYIHGLSFLSYQIFCSCSTPEPWCPGFCLVVSHKIRLGTLRPNPQFRKVKPYLSLWSGSWERELTGPLLWQEGKPRHPSSGICKEYFSLSLSLYVLWIWRETCKHMSSLISACSATRVMAPHPLEKSYKEKFFFSTMCSYVLSFPFLLLFRSLWHTVHSAYFSSYFMLSFNVPIASIMFST